MPYYNRGSAVSYGQIINAANYGFVMDGSLAGTGTDNTTALTSAWAALTSSTTATDIILPRGICVTRSAASLALPNTKKLARVWADGWHHVYDNQDASPGRPIRILGEGTGSGIIEWHGGRSRISRGARRIANLDQISFDWINKTRLYGIVVETAENMGLTINRGIVDTWIPEEIIYEEITVGGYLPEYGGAQHVYGSIGDTAHNIWCPAMDTRVRGAYGGSTGDDFFFIGHSSQWDNAGVRRSISISEVHGRNCINGIGINCPDVTIRDSSVYNVMVCGLRMVADNLEGATSSPTGVGASRSKAHNVKVEKHGYLTAADLGSTSLLISSTSQAAIQVSGNDIVVENSTVDWCVNEAFKVIAAIDGTTTQSNITSRNNVFKRAQHDSSAVRKAQATSRGVISRGPATTSTHFVTSFRSENDLVVDTNAIPLLWDAGISTGDDNVAIKDMVLDNVDLSGTTISAVRVVASSTGRCKNVSANFILRNGTTIGRPLQTSGGSTNRDDVRVTSIRRIDTVAGLNEIEARYYPGVMHGVTGTRDARLIGEQYLGMMYMRADAAGQIVAQFDSTQNLLIEAIVTSTSGTHTNVASAFLKGRWAYIASGNLIIPLEAPTTIGASNYTLTLQFTVGNTTMNAAGSVELVSAGSPWSGSMGVMTRAWSWAPTSYGELLT